MSASAEAPGASSKSSKKVTHKTQDSKPHIKPGSKRKRSPEHAAAELPQDVAGADVKITSKDEPANNPKLQNSCARVRTKKKARIQSGSGLPEAPAGPAQPDKNGALAAADQDPAADGEGGETETATPSGKKRKHKAAQAQEPVELPLVSGMTSNRNSPPGLLLQLSEEGLDFAGETGAIGRVSAVSSSGIKIDLKGNQYDGALLPCATMMVVNVGAGDVKVESIYNDFVDMSFAGNVFAQMGGAITQGAMDASYQPYREVNVNAAKGEGGSDVEGRSALPSKAVRKRKTPTKSSKGRAKK